MTETRTLGCEVSFLIINMKIVISIDQQQLINRLINEYKHIFMCFASVY